MCSVVCSARVCVWAAEGRGNKCEKIEVICCFIDNWVERLNPGGIGVHGGKRCDSDWAEIRGSRFLEATGKVKDLEGFVKDSVGC